MLRYLSLECTCSALLIAHCFHYSLLIAHCSLLINHCSMFRHNVILIYRNFKRFRSTFFINLIGLSTGLACALLIYLWVNDELQMDKFHEKDSRLFLVMSNQKNVDNIVKFPNTPGLLAPALLQEIPGIDYAVSTSGWIGKFILSHDNSHV